VPNLIRIGPEPFDARIHRDAVPHRFRVAVAERLDEARIAADKLVDEFFSDLKTSEKTSPELSAEFHVESTLDEIVTLMMDASRNTAPLTALDADPAPAADPAMRGGGVKRPLKDKPPKTAHAKTATASGAAVAPVDEVIASGIDSDAETFDFPELDAVAPPLPATPERTGVMAAARQVEAEAHEGLGGARLLEAFALDRSVDDLFGQVERHEIRDHRQSDDEQDPQLVGPGMLPDVAG
jgi:hypothetical protein